MDSKIIIGTILKNPKYLYLVDDFLKPHHFEDHVAAKAYEIICANNSFTVYDICSQLGEDITSWIDLASHIEMPKAARRLVEKYLCFELKARAQSLIEISETGDIERAYEMLEETIAGVSRETGGSEIDNISKPLSESINNLNERIRKSKNGLPLGIKTPFQDLQFYTNGLQPGMYVLGARPGQGKTAMGIKFMTVAASSGFPVAYFSLEMSARSLTDRMLLGISGVDKDAFKSGTLTGSDMMLIETAKESLNSLPIFILDDPSQTISNIQRDARLLKRKHGISMIIIDYLQLIKTQSSNKKYNREQEVSEISRYIKLLSKELDIPIIIMAQLNRESERDGKMHRPGTAQLRESGALEQDADMIILLFRPDIANIPDAQINTVELIIGKHREGQLGIITVKHNGSMTDFYDIDKSFNNF